MNNARLKTNEHCVKNVQIRNFFRSVFSRILTKKNYVFGHFSKNLGNTLNLDLQWQTKILPLLRSLARFFYFL